MPLSKPSDSDLLRRMPLGQSQDPTPKALKSYPLTTGTGTFVPASNAFGFHLLSTLIKGDHNAGASANVFLSPLSLSLALTMTMDGAGGQTRQQMQTALGYRSAEAPGKLDADARALLVQYQGKHVSPDVTTAIASALWPSATMPSGLGQLDPRFAAHAAQIFGAPVQAVDFTDVSGARRVNAWTSEHTRGKITAILPEKPLSAALVLTNAVYFKAKWNQHFLPEDTKPGTFTTGQGQKKTLPMMQQIDNFAYQKSNGFQAIQLPYDDGRFSLHLLLPDHCVALRTFTANHLASAASWDGYLSRFGTAKVALKLPRFKLAYDAGELVPPLTKLGMTAACAAGADFRPMGYPKAYIGSVRHKTTLVVDEAGSEATAATAVVMAPGGAAPRPETIIPFVVDRPFVCGIRDNATGALLFLGLVTQPERV